MVTPRVTRPAVPVVTAGAASAAWPNDRNGGTGEDRRGRQGSATVARDRWPRRTSIQNNSGQPKDLPSPLWYAERAAYRPGGGSPHVRHETARVHDAARRRGYVAARGARAAAGDAGHRVPQQRITGSVLGRSAHVPA